MLQTSNQHMRNQRQKSMHSLRLFVFLAISVLPHLGLCNLDLYLPKYEVKKLFGLDDMELYYIRDGTVNHNAIRFTPHVQPEQDTMTFMWKSTFINVEVPYEVEQTILKDPDGIDANATLSDLVEPLSVDIEKSGKVSHMVSKFQLLAPCTGMRAGEVVVQMKLKLQLNVEDNPQEITTVNLRRLRRCIETHEENIKQIDKNVGLNLVNKKSDIKDITSNHLNPDMPDVTGLGSRSSDSFFISISVVTGTIMLSLFAFFVAWKTQTTKKHKPSTAGPTGTNQCLRPDIPNNVQVVTQVANWMKLTPIKNDLGTDISEIKIKLSSITVSHETVSAKEILTEGTFGKIYKGFLNEDVPVIIKTVSEFASDEQVRLLLYDSSLLKGMHHSNILSIKKVVLDGPTKPMVLLPHVKGGNLKRYLQDLKFTGPSANMSISENDNKYEHASTQDLVKIGIQIACGMTYMNNRGIVHKDLATRNCIIDSEFKVKITDNALSRDLFPDDYCCLGNNENRPVGWLAIESLVHKIFSTSSDVWSFGVVLWELQSFAANPYSEIDAFELERYLKNGYRLGQPLNCPDHLYEIMAQCWHYSPDNRPRFNLILQMLTEFNAELGEYV